MRVNFIHTRTDKHTLSHSYSVDYVGVYGARTNLVTSTVERNENRIVRFQSVYVMEWVR